MIGKRLIGTSDSLRLNLTHVGRTDKGMDNTMTHRIWYKPARTLLAATALIFFAVANLFPIVKIELLGHEQFITIPKTFMTLIDQGFYIVGLLCAFLIFLFPLMVFSLYTAIFILFKLKKGRQLTKELLVLLSYALKWNMSDIFLISILVALVKLIGYAQIHMGVAFWALIVYVVIDIYLTRQIHLSEMWMLRKRIYGEAR